MDALRERLAVPVFDRVRESVDVRHEPVAAAPGYDRKYFLVSAVILLAIIIFSTWLHHWQPQILRVPDNRDVSSWVNPTFEQTCVYRSASPAEREKLRREGVPGDTLGALIFMDVFAFLLGLLCFRHAWKNHGFWMAWSFFIGSFVFTGLQESMWILFGRFTGTSAAQGIGEVAPGTYWFTKDALWFFETPVMACMGWFYIAYGCVWLAGKAFPRSSLLVRAIAGGLIAMIVDLWADPISTAPELMMWVWATEDFVRIFGIPQSNFLGWFLLIFVFAIIWEQLPRWDKTLGRPAATKRFFLVLLVSDVAILLFQYPWCYGLRAILMAAGVEHTLYIPSGW